MYLYFLRHGEADWPNWSKPDDERPLTERGKKEIQKVADFLKLLDVSLDHVVTSPLPRAKQTAEIVADRLKLKLREDKTLEPGFDQAGLKRILQKHADSPLMLVGHEPDFTRAIRALSDATLKLSKGGIALLDVDSASMKGKLLWLVPPRIAKATR
jgi:phosphohistidine phosphatase